jgi:predicted transcriptional regulator
MDRLPVVREYMARKLLTLQSDTEILDVVAFLLKHKISGAPVVDNDKQLVGVISEKDCLNLLAKGVSANVAHGSVAEFMTTEVETISPDIDLYYAAGLFLKSNYRRFPVVEDGVLVGQISRRDILRAIHHHLK